MEGKETVLQDLVVSSCHLTELQCCEVKGHRSNIETYRLRTANISSRLTDELCNEIVCMSIQLSTE